MFTLRLDDAIESSRAEIDAYLTVRHMGTDNFYKETCDFFVNAREHYRRLLLCERIASHLTPKADLSNKKDRNRVFRTLGDANKVHQSTWQTWANGAIDPDLSYFYLYHDSTKRLFDMPELFDTARATRFAIPRTLTFIRVFPWPKTPRSCRVPLEQKRAWRMIRSHPCNSGRTSRNVPITQAALDTIMSSSLGKSFTIDDIGLLKLKLETCLDATNPWLWPFAIFKYATFARLPDGSDNIHLPIWARSSDDYHFIWDNING